MAEPPASGDNRPMPYELAPLAERDRERVIDIFNHYIENSFAAYPEQPVPYEFFDRFLGAEHSALAVRTDAGETVGFALLRPWHPASSFRRTGEIGYFLEPSHTGKGAGALILEHLTAGARSLGIDNLLASISSLNEGSIRFHQRHGFSECGRFRAVGRKRGRDFDVVWMQKQI